VFVFGYLSDLVLRIQPQNSKIYLQTPAPFLNFDRDNKNTIPKKLMLTLVWWAMILGLVDTSHCFALERNKACLKDGGLVLAVGSIEAREARASSIGIVADTSSRAVTSGLVTISVKRIGTRGALLELASRSSVPGIAEAPDVLHVIPRSVVGATRLDSQVLLRPASTTVVTVVRASGTLA